MKSIEESMLQNLFVKNARQEGDYHLIKAAELLDIEPARFDNYIKKQAFAQFAALLSRVPWGTIGKILAHLPWDKIVDFVSKEENRKMVFEIPNKIKEAVENIVLSEGDTEEGVKDLIGIYDVYKASADKMQETFESLKNVINNVDSSEEEMELAKEEFIKAEKGHTDALKEVEAIVPGDIEVSS